MIEKITHSRLPDFVEANKSSGFDFAQYTYDCGATSFVDKSREFHREKNKSIWIYRFNEYYLNPKNFHVYPYFVIAVPEKSYLMYEIGDEISVWVCYTEKNHRKHGYMKELLKYIKDKYRDKLIIVDTYNESLRKLCIDNGLSILEKKL